VSCRQKKKTRNSSGLHPTNACRGWDAFFKQKYLIATPENAVQYFPHGKAPNCTLQVHILGHDFFML
jgi:hypothetical protein